MFDILSRLFLYFISCIALTYSWTWDCENGFCIRNSNPIEKTGYSSLELCELICSNYLNIWPHPTKTVTSLKNIINVNPNDIILQLKAPPVTHEFLKGTYDYFLEHLPSPTNCQLNAYSVILNFESETDELDLNLDTNEMYNLEVDFTGKNITVAINAQTVFGVRHGIETFLQLVVPYEDRGSTCLATLSNVQISDKPVYRHRGLLIDTARNFLMTDSIKRTIDGMASSKLNVLHWHITDSQSFPLRSLREPNMTKFGAYSSQQIYTPNVVKDIIGYAKLRGVRVLLEVDGPSHAGFGWQWGKEAGIGNLALCVNAQPWRWYCIQPPCGQLNPSNPNLYTVMKHIFEDIKDLLGNIPMFHMGGDEVSISCWNSSQEIITYLKDKPLTLSTFLDLWAEHQANALAAFDEAVGSHKTPVVVWTSHLTQPEIIKQYLSTNRYIIQTWVPEANNSLITDLLNLGYKIIISTKDRWYLDHGFWGNTVYHNWNVVYDNKMYSYFNEGILGGEVCMWGELVDDHNIDSRIWPRAAAAAERLWSNPRTPANIARGRFFAQNGRLKRRNIQTELVIPQWCVQNQGECDTYL